MNSYLQSARGEMAPYPDRLDAIYPEVTKRLKPHIDKATGSYNGGPLSEEMIHGMTREAVDNSGIVHDLPLGHSADTVDDLAKTLVLTNLDYPYDGYGYPYPPYFLLPFHHGFYRGFRGGFRGHR